MEKKVITLEIKKQNKKSLLEWTETLELDYLDVKKDQQFEQARIEKNEKKKNDNENKNHSLINTYVLSMKNNPFYQPAMNTIEFETNTDKTTINMYTSENQKLNLEEKLLILEKLLKENHITYEEYLKQKKQIGQE